MAVAVHAVRRARLSPGERAVIIGVGGIGAFLTHPQLRARVSWPAIWKRNCRGDEFHSPGRTAAGRRAAERKLRADPGPAYSSGARNHRNQRARHCDRSSQSGRLLAASHDLWSDLAPLMLTLEDLVADGLRPSDIARPIKTLGVALGRHTPQIPHDGTRTASTRLNRFAVEPRDSHLSRLIRARKTIGLRGAPNLWGSLPSRTVLARSAAPPASWTRRTHDPPVIL